MIPGFRRSFLEADKRGLVFVNPRPNYGRADTLESALEEKQFRVKNMVRPSGDCCSTASAAFVGMGE